LSIAFFQQPNYDAMIECLPTCTQPGQKPRYEPVTSGAHRRAKLDFATTEQKHES
jgi:isopenicillin N synthase-like dioxygenase